MEQKIIALGGKGAGLLAHQHGATPDHEMYRKIGELVPVLGQEGGTA